jgi:Ni2+-binding GTPase involved in maturation of urease and hydrogenase
MRNGATISALPAARAVIVRIIERVLREGCSLLNVESPPGAGKTALVEAMLVSAVGVAGLRAAVITPHAEQTYDLLRRVVSHY